MGDSAFEWREEMRPCPICGSSRSRVLGKRGGSSHHAGLGQATTIVRCRACHSVYPRPMLLPSGNPYARHEPGEYFHAHKASRKIKTGRALARMAKRWLGGTGRWLELGCGRGDLLAGAAQEGWTVSGVDMTPAFADCAPGVEIEIAPLERAESLNSSHDVIVLAAILEHLYDPVACIERCHNSLVNGGLLFIDVPNECGLWTRAGNAYLRFRGKKWCVNLSPTFPPYHVVGFCPRSLRQLLTQAGFEILHLSSPPWRSTLPRALLFGRQIDEWLVNLLLRASGLFGMGAGLFCWARKTRHAAL
jgi:SAM-dependent methyltransferase